jgi:hypothetical protein
MLGKLSDIRKRFNDMATKKQPRWRFDNDRQHWVLREATDQGFSMKGAWRIKFGANKPLLESPVQCWRAEGAPSLDLKIAYLGRATTARIFWKRLDDDKYDGKKSCGVDLNPDGKFHAFHVNLASSVEYRDLIIGLAIEPVAQSRPGEGMAIKSIEISAARN